MTKEEYQDFLRGRRGWNPMIIGRHYQGMELGGVLRHANGSITSQGDGPASSNLKGLAMGYIVADKRC